MRKATKNQIDQAAVFSHFTGDMDQKNRRKAASRHSMNKLNEKRYQQGMKNVSFSIDNELSKVLDEIQKAVLVETGVKPTIKNEVINALIQTISQDSEKMNEVIDLIKASYEKEAC